MDGHAVKLTGVSYAILKILRITFYNEFSFLTA